MYEVIPEVVCMNNGQAESLDYSHITGVLVNAINELDKKYTSTITQMQSQIDALTPESNME